MQINLKISLNKIRKLKIEKKFNNPNMAENVPVNLVHFFWRESGRIHPKIFRHSDINPFVNGFLNDNRMTE